MDNTNMDNANEIEPEVEEDINQLLELLSQESTDDDIDELEEEETSSNSDAPVSVDSPVADPELSLFADEEGDAIFADSPEALEEETTDSQSDEGKSVDDIFGDALSAVGYSEKEDTGLDDLLALDEESAGSDDEAVEEDTKKKKKKEKKKKEPKPPKEPKPEGEPGFFQRVFGNVITEQTAEEEARERELEKASEEERQAAKAEKKQQQAAEKAEKAEAARAEKEKKKAEKAERAAAKAAEKEEKKRRRAELEATEVVGKINPIGATIVMMFFGLVCVAILLGTHTFSYSHAVNVAKSEFEKKDYRSAYNSIAGVKVSESAKEMEDKIRICMQLQKELDSYENYYKMRMYLESLDSLIKGIRSYDTNMSKAEEYEIVSQYNELESQIASSLYSEFGVTETEARRIISSETQEDYTAKLEAIIKQWEAQNAQDEK